MPASVHQLKASIKVSTLLGTVFAGKLEDCKEFFRTIYSFIYELGTYLKPHVSIHDSQIINLCILLSSLAFYI